MPAKNVVTVQVRELVEFARREGDLGSSRDFVGSQRALAGTRGHQRLQKSRPAGYQKEVRLSREIDAGDFVLKVQGRIDGVLESDRSLLIEEIKTVDRRWNEQADPLHWAQAKVYAFIYGGEHGFEKITVQLSYLGLEDDRVLEFLSDFQLSELRAHFEAAVDVYIRWLRERNNWCLLRDESIRGLAFPFPRYRPGQREMAVAVYRALARGGRLFAEAPTGIGKTMSVIFPALKALSEGKLERLFYLTARTVGKVVAEEAFARLRAQGLRLQTLSLTAKERICPRAGQVACDPADCLLARGYYERNKAAMREALELAEITRPVLDSVSQKHQVCPFELSLDLSVWVDAVICDYNYVFDPKVYLRRHFDEKPCDYAFLVDEAHNLVDRAREMFSAELDGRQIRDVRRAIKDSLPRCARALSKLNTALRKLARVPDTQAAESDSTGPGDDLDLFSTQNRPAELSGQGAPADCRAPEQVNGSARDETRAFRTLPENLVAPLGKVLTEAEIWLAKNEPAPFREQLLDLYFRLHSFRRTMELYDERYVTLVGPEHRVKLFCLDPSFLLGEAFARGKAVILFSATLSPLEYYRDLLAGGPDAVVLQLPSPFPAENLAVLLHHRVRTQLRERGSSLRDVVNSIGAMIVARPGNYLVYFPSYAYLNSVLERFAAVYPQFRMLAQRPRMTDAERESFLAQFSRVQEGTLVGFAVMGGIFGEGIDLVGERLIGVVVVGVGLPQLSAERDQIRDYFQEKLGRGFDYAYTFPGMNRVLQATGRVIRSETDRGVVLLIDARFAERRYLALFPRWWQPLRVHSSEQIEQAVCSFWGDEQAISAPSSP